MASGGCEKQGLVGAKNGQTAQRLSLERLGRSEKATVPRSFTHCLQPPHCRAGEPWSPAGMWSGVRVHHCFCVRALCPVGYEQRKPDCPGEERRCRSRDQVNDTGFPLPHLAPDGTKIMFRISGMWRIQRGTCTVAGVTWASSHDPCPRHRCWLLAV